MAAPVPFYVRVVEQFSTGRPGRYQQTDLGKVPNGGASYEARIYDAGGALRGTLRPQPIESMKATLVGMRDILEGTFDTSLRPVSDSHKAAKGKFQRSRQRAVLTMLERTMEED